MDYTNLYNNPDGKVSKVGIIGATRGYGYTLLAQIPKVKNMELRVICSRHTDECMGVLKEIGYDENRIAVCQDKGQIRGCCRGRNSYRGGLSPSNGMRNYRYGGVYRKHCGEL